MASALSLKFELNYGKSGRYTIDLWVGRDDEETRKLETVIKEVYGRDVELGAVSSESIAEHVYRTFSEKYPECDITVKVNEEKEPVSYMPLLMPEIITCSITKTFKSNKDTALNKVYLPILE